jgi:rare lipoprotein A
LKIQAYILFIACLLSLTLSAQVKHGTASFYAQKFEGRRCASGERFCQDSLTCAHNSLPFGTLIKVCGNNNECVVVKVNDRLGKRSHRTIDLSRKAATLIGLTHAGFMKVSYEVVGKDTIIVAKHVYKPSATKKKKKKKRKKKAVSKSKKKTTSHPKKAVKPKQVVKPKKAPAAKTKSQAKKK